MKLKNMKTGFIKRTVMRQSSMKKTDMKKTDMKKTDVKQTFYHILCRLLAFALICGVTASPSTVRAESGNLSYLSYAPDIKESELYAR